MDIPFLIDTFWIALSGVPITLIVTLVALTIALPASFFLALTRLNEIPILNNIAKLYVSFVRGTPIIIQIFIVYSSIPLILDIIFKAYEINIKIYDIHPIWYAFIVFSFNTTAILIEVFRSALGTVPKGQLEAAQSVGLTVPQAYRRIIIPQALIIAIPNICTTTVNLIKATSLGYAMSLYEVTLKAKVAANVGYNYLEAYIDIFVVYLILCSIVEFSFKRYEKYLRRHTFAQA